MVVIVVINSILCNLHDYTFNYNFKYTITMKAYSILLTILVATTVASGGAPNKVLTPAQWTDLHNSSQAARLAAKNGPTKDARHLTSDEKRDAASWIIEYFREFEANGEFVPHIAEQSFMERVANLLNARQYNSINLNIDRVDMGPSAKTIDARMIEGSRVNHDLCTKHLESMLGQIEQLNNCNSSCEISESQTRLARVLDSFGRFESGYFSGNMYSFGSYEQCISTSLMFSEPVRSPEEVEMEQRLVESRYCWAKVDMRSFLSKAVRERQKDLMEHNQLEALQVGICIPSSCHSVDFETNRHLFERLIWSQFQLPRWFKSDDGALNISLSCLIDQDSPVGAHWSIGAKLFIVCVCIWSMMVLYATFVVSRSSNASQWSCLDLGSSWNELIGEGNVNSRQHLRFIEMDTLNLVKIICLLLLVLGHSFLLSVPIYKDLMRIPSSITESWLDPLFCVVHLTVNAYFVISAMLITYFCLKKIQPRINIDSNPKNVQKVLQPPLKVSLTKFWLGLAVARYTRLIPMLALAFWFKKSIFVHLGSGPLWDYALNRETPLGGCVQEESWLAAFGLDPGLPVVRQCYPTTWTVRADLIYSCILMPPIIWLLSRRPKLGLSLIVACVFISQKAAENEYYNLPLSFQWELEQFSFTTVPKFTLIGSALRTSVLVNLVASSIGTLTGFALWKYDTSTDGEQSSKRHWPDWFKYVLFRILVILMLLILVSCQFTDYFARNLSSESKIYLARQPFSGSQVIFSAGFASLFLLMVTDWRQSNLMRFFSNKLWRILSQLNYIIMMIHMDLLQYNLSIRQADEIYSRWNYLKLFSHTCLVSLVISVIIHVCIERPISKLISLNLRRILGG